MKSLAKKVLCLALAASMTMCFVACGDDETTEQPTLTTVEDVSDLDDEVKISIPLSSIEEEYQDNLDAYAEKYGYSSAKLDKKSQNVILTMNAFTHTGLVTRIGMKVIKNIYAFEEDKDYPYLVSVDEVNTDDFSSATITVKSKGYKAAGTTLPFYIGQYLLLYQIYKGEGYYDVTVTVKNTKGKVIDTLTYSNEDK